MPTVVQEFTGNDQSVIRAYTRIIEHQRKMEAGLEKLVEKTKAVDTEQQKLERSAARLGQSLLTPQEKHAAKVAEINTLYGKQLISLDQQQKGLKQADELLKKQVGSQNDLIRIGSQGLQQIGAMVTGYVSLNTVAMIYNKTLEHRETLEKRAKDLTVTSADAQRNMLRNLGDVSESDQTAFDDRLQNLNRKYRPKGGMPAVYAEAASALSASQASRPRTLAAMEAAMQFAPDSADTRVEIAGGVLDLRKATKSENPMTNLGLIKAIGEQSRLTDWAKISRNLSGAVVSVQEYGGTPQNAAALIAAITQASVDPEGRRSASAAVGMVEQLERYLPEENKYDYRLNPQTMRMQQIISAKGTGLKDWLSRVNYLRANPKELERVLGDLSAEKRQKAAIRQILTGKGAGAEAFNEAMVAMNVPLDELGRRAEQKIDLMNRPFGQRVAQADRANESSSGDLNNTIMGKERSLEGLFSQKLFKEKLGESGLGWWDTTIEGLDYYAGGGNNQEAFARGVNKRISYLRNTSADRQVLFDNPVDPSRLQMADKLEAFLNEQIQQGKSLREEIAKLRQSFDGQRAAYDRSQNRPNPVGVQNNLKQHGEGGR